MEYFGRERIQEIFDKSHLLFSYLLFIDDFDVHQNNYRFLKAFYLTSATLFYQKRRKVVNVFTLTLESHEIKVDDVIAFIVKSIRRMNSGVDMIINKEIVFVCAFELTLIDDMPQQVSNDEFFHHFARRECRSCYCLKKERENLEYDVIVDERYHREVINQRKYVNDLTNKDKNIYLQEMRIKKDSSSIARLVPALNFILFRTYDAFHSE